VPNEVVTDLAPTYPVVVEELLPTACHRTDRHANNRIEADHGRLKARLRPMRGLRPEHSPRVVIAGHAFVQDVRRGHYELAAEEPVKRDWQSPSTSSPWRSEAPPTVTTPARANRPDATRPLAEPSPPSFKATPGVPSGQVCSLHGD
jgi:DDE domain